MNYSDKKIRISKIIGLYKLAKLAPTILVDKGLFLDAITGIKKRDMVKIPQVIV